MQAKQKFQESAKQDLTYSALFGLARSYKSQNNTWHFKFLWGRIFILLFSLALAGWILLSTIIYIAFKYTRNYDEMTFLKAIIMPFNRAGHNTMVGDYNIQKAKEAMEVGTSEKYREAYESVRDGVSRSPRNLDGKMILSKFYIHFFNRPDYGIKALESGFPAAKENPEYMTLYIQTLLQESEDLRLARVASKLLDIGVKNETSRLQLALALGTVYALHGGYSKSNEVIKKYGLENSVQGLIRISKNSWEQGLHDEAISILVDNVSKMYKPEPIYALLMSYYNILGDYETAKKYATLRAIEDPLSVKQRVDYLKLLSKSGHKPEADKQIEVVFKQYKSDARSLVYVANYAAVEGNLDLMKRIYDTALRNNYPIAPFCLLYLESMLSLGNYQSAADFAEEISREKPLWSRRYEDVLKCLKIVAYYAVGNISMSEVLLNEIVGKESVPVKNLVATARRLDKLNASMFAYKLLESAVRKDPKHLLALTRLVQMDIKIGNSTNLNKNISKLLTMRRPPKELIEDARNNLNSDKFIFTQDRDKIMKNITMLVTREASEKSFINMGTSYEEGLDNSMLEN